MRTERLIPLGAPPLVTCRQLAKWFTVSIGTIHNWSKSGVLPPPVQLGPRIFRWETHRVRGWLKRIETAADLLGLTGTSADEPADDEAGELVSSSAVELTCTSG